MYTFKIAQNTITTDTKTIDKKCIFMSSGIMKFLTGLNVYCKFPLLKYYPKYMFDSHL